MDPPLGCRSITHVAMEIEIKVCFTEQQMNKDKYQVEFSLSIIHSNQPKVELGGQPKSRDQTITIKRVKNMYAKRWAQH